MPENTPGNQCYRTEQTAYNLPIERPGRLTGHGLTLADLSFNTILLVAKAIPYRRRNNCVESILDAGNVQWFQEVRKVPSSSMISFLQGYCVPKSVLLTRRPTWICFRRAPHWWEVRLEARELFRRATDVFAC